MELLANENIPLASVIYLRSQGFDIKSIGIDHLGISDEEVMDIAIEENRTIVTHDSDYGELIFKHGYHPAVGVIYIRKQPTTPTETAHIVENIVNNTELNFAQTLTVLDSNGVRQKEY
ncbi:DUF5615 family PIN-like protein [Tunicatimonas pelagia]|uniref:DUF5615 family PIN-like protein n=1 Tax=Tunicatimonas pelagia TaxID=931531 RepID=UPI0026652B8A|nr:DUF5615 family PIN-like protein [Tunicatimonas pelagia]WKN41673.1 DUF5615 family PIN-like protein [Tunicatimonas pelagia]